ncbi:TRAP transporter small permease subunit [Thalassospiraceae bacterium LMO-JJ14]|nr:TRAP transporter small permease subunit [Thalassospiraceae bacterium LMO-JJ14]
MSHGTQVSGSNSAEIQVNAESHGLIVTATRIFALVIAIWALIFIANNILNFWFDWPSTLVIYGSMGLFGNTAPADGIDPRAWLQLMSYAGSLLLIAFFVLKSSTRTLHADSEMLGGIAGYIIRAAFWSVLLIGIVDGFISFLRVEGFIGNVLGEQLAEDLGRSSYRGQMVHYPIMVLSLIIAKFNRNLGFHWLAVLIVAAELLIVIARFVFSYEQAFMADLVRFWYGALFLFASPYTLIKEGHVRVDILYTGFSRQGKALANTIGCIFLGMPLCWVILTMGMWGKANTINGPLLSFEVTQSGYGLYIKYLLAGFLLIFALSMLVQFMSYLLSNVATLLHEPGHEQDLEEHAAI